MPDLDLDAIEARANAASPMPWAFYDDDLWRGVTAEQLAAYDAAAERGDDPEWPGGADQVFHGDPKVVEDAEFVAHARGDVPALTAEVRRAHALIVKLWKVANPTDYPVHDAIRQAGYGSMIFEASR